MNLKTYVYILKLSILLVDLIRQSLFSGIMNKVLFEGRNYHTYVMNSMCHPCC